MVTKAIYRFNMIAIKLPMTFFTEMGQIILKFYMESQKIQNCQSNSEEKEQSGSIAFPGFRQYSKWLEDLNIRQDTIKFLEEIIGIKFSDINCINVFLDQSPKAIEIF